MAWNKSERNTTTGNTVQKKRINTRLVGAVAGIIVVVGAVIAWLLISPTPQPQPTSEPVKVENKQRQRNKPKTIPTEKKVAKQASVMERPATKKSALAKDDIVSTTVTTNKSGAVIERLVMADGTTRSKIHPPAPVFKRVSDQVIALCLSTKPGQSMPPLPMLDKSLERDFVEAMSEPIEILETDPPNVKELKAQVMETRAYLKDEIKSGRTTLLDALKEHQRSMETTADAHSMALQEVQKMRRNGGTQSEVDEFIKAVNESFKARGIPEITRNKTHESRRRK